MFNKKKGKIMNKSAVFWFEFFSKHFGPGASSVESKVFVTPLMKGQARNA